MLKQDHYTQLYALNISLRILIFLRTPEAAKKGIVNV